MIKVSVMYPESAGTRFDHDYYRTMHLPLIESRMGPGLKYYAIDKGLASGTPGAPAPFVAMCHLFCASVEAYQASFGPHARDIGDDIRNFTDREPVVLVSEVVVERSR